MVSHPTALSTRPKTTSALAVWALVLGILALLLVAFFLLFLFAAHLPIAVLLGGFGVGALLALLAAVCGHRSGSAISNPFLNLKGSGLATAGIALGYFGVIFGVGFC